ncbi:MAG: hypothetical protein K2K27_08510 [Muribaculaceae bacterium]|nr:hypothetical protein [Muribaculaceae bacterium]
MQKKRLTEIKELLSTIPGKKSSPVALFPHRTGTNVSLNEYIRTLPGSCEIVKGRSGYDHEEKSESSFFFFNFGNVLIPTRQEYFVQILDKVVEVAKGNNLVVIFDDWEGNRHEEMRPDIENALNWLKEYPESFDIFSCEARAFDSNGKAID